MFSYLFIFSLKILTQQFQCFFLSKKPTFAGYVDEKKNREGWICIYQKKKKISVLYIPRKIQKSKTLSEENEINIKNDNGTNTLSTLKQSSPTCVTKIDSSQNETNSNDSSRADSKTTKEED